MDIFNCQLAAKQVMKLTGLSYARLDYWLRPERGNIVTCTVPAQGKGSDRVFSFLDVIRIRAVKRLRDRGVSLQMVRKVVRELTERYQIKDPLAETGQLLVAGDRLFWVLDDTALLDVLKGQLAAHPLMILPVAEIIADTRAKVAALMAA